MAIALESGQSAGSDRAVVFACDGGYAPFAWFAALQIARMLPGRDFDIVAVMTDGTEPPASLAGCGIRSARISTGGVFDGLGLDARRTDAVYACLALPAAFADDYSRVLFLDADVFVQGGDFSGLLGVDLAGRALAAVRDNIQWRTPDRRVGAFKQMSLSAGPYFNSGVMLMDVPEYNAQRVLERCIELGSGRGRELKGHDQDLLNVILYGQWAEISPIWNWQYTRSSMLFEAMEGANIVHFIGAKKPWKHSGGALPVRFRREYRGFLAQHYPERKSIGPDGLAPHQNRAYLRKSLVRHAMAAGRMCDYLDRFECELSVVV